MRFGHSISAIALGLALAATASAQYGGGGGNTNYGEWTATGSLTINSQSVSASKGVTYTGTADTTGGPPGGSRGEVTVEYRVYSPDGTTPGAWTDLAVHGEVPYNGPNMNGQKQFQDVRWPGPAPIGAGNGNIAPYKGGKVELRYTLYGPVKNAQGTIVQEQKAQILKSSTALE